MVSKIVVYVDVLAPLCIFLVDKHITSLMYRLIIVKMLCFWNCSCSFLWHYCDGSLLEKEGLVYYEIHNIRLHRWFLLRFHHWCSTIFKKNWNSKDITKLFLIHSLWNVTVEKCGSEAGAVPQDRHHLLCAVHPSRAAVMVCDGHQMSSDHQPHCVCTASRHEFGRRVS